MITQGERAEGWYRDPAPANPGRPTNMRWWDGEKWTTRIRAAKRGERDAWATELAEENAARAATRARDAGVGLAAPMPASHTTPEGQSLAGWWRRAVATWCDGLVMMVLGLVISYRLLLRLAEVSVAFAARTQAALETGRRPPDPTATFATELAGPAVGIAVVFWAVSFVYTVAFLKGFGATPGKMLLRMQVRPQAAPGALSWRAVLLRWLVQHLPSLANLVPFGAIAGAAFSLLDHLWPVWDGQRQALHDKAAGTVVVRR